MKTGTGHLGEFDRIRRFFAPLTRRAPGAFDLTDDAAVLSAAPDADRWVVTTDALVAGVHFLADDPPDLVARKALRVNISDLAAMGARPGGYTLALALPGTLEDPEGWLDRFAAGLAEDQRAFGIDLFGGDSVSTPGPVTISVTAFGLVAEGGVLRRSGARAGDDLWVSGTIGDAALGLDILQGRIAADAPDLVDRYRLPQPRSALGPRLSGLATAALDVSDGLVQDAGHIAAQSACAVVIDAPSIPLSASARDLLGADVELFVRVLEGGDDYELLFTAPTAAGESVAATAEAAGVPVQRIGRVEPGQGVTVVDRQGEPIEGLNGGWQHF